MSFQPEAFDDSAEFIFGIARSLPVVSEIESFFVQADAVKTAIGIEKIRLKCRINFMT
jgi:hypothetical protein